jgi:hypothetical protein
MKKLILIFLLLFTIKSFAEGPAANLYYFVGGLQVTNITLIIWNNQQISHNSTTGRAVPILGISFGTLNLATGVGLIADGDVTGILPGVISIWTLYSSIRNLSRDWQSKDKRTIWNLQSFPMHDKNKSVGIGFSFAKKF